MTHAHMGHCEPMPVRPLVFLWSRRWAIDMPEKQNQVNPTISCSGWWFCVSDALVNDSTSSRFIFGASRHQISRDGKAKPGASVVTGLYAIVATPASTTVCIRHMYSKCNINNKIIRVERTCKVALTDVHRNPSQIKREAAVAFCKTRYCTLISMRSCGCHNECKSNRLAYTAPSGNACCCSRPGFCSYGCHTPCRTNRPA